MASLNVISEDDFTTENIMKKYNCSVFLALNLQKNIIQHYELTEMLFKSLPLEDKWKLSDDFYSSRADMIKQGLVASPLTTSSVVKKQTIFNDNGIPFQTSEMIQSSSSSSSRFVTEAHEEDEHNVSVYNARNDYLVNTHVFNSLEKINVPEYTLFQLLDLVQSVSTKENKREKYWYAKMRVVMQVQECSEEDKDLMMKYALFNDETGEYKLVEKPARSVFSDDSLNDNDELFFDFDGFPMGQYFSMSAPYQVKYDFLKGALKLDKPIFLYARSVVSRTEEKNKIKGHFALGTNYLSEPLIEKYLKPEYINAEAGDDDDNDEHEQNKQNVRELSKVLVRYFTSNLSANKIFINREFGKSQANLRTPRKRPHSRSSIAASESKRKSLFPAPSDH